jgi:hypothetical protein
MLVTSDSGGLSNDQIAEMATNKIVYVSEGSPEGNKASSRSI